MDNDLELVGTYELVEELKKRFDHSIFVGVRDGADEEEAVVSYNSNSFYMLLGLAERVKFRIHSDIDPTTVEGTEI